MFQDTSQNPPYVIHPNNQVFTAIPTYTPQSTTRYVTNNNSPRTLVTPNNNNYYTTSGSTITNTNSHRSNQPILVVNPHQNYPNNVNTNGTILSKNPVELEKVRVIGNNEREFFKDGTSVLRAYKYLFQSIFESTRNSSKSYKSLLKLKINVNS